MPEINSLRGNGSLRVHTRANQPRTSSNKTFQDQFRGGLRSGVDLTNSALRQVGKPIPGSAALSASLSDAAQSLSQPSSLDGSGKGLSSSASVNGDMDSLQNEMVRNNQELLEQQVKVSHMSTVYNAQSNLIKAYHDAQKNIAANLRP